MVNVIDKKLFIEAKQRKLKLKKNALEPVNMEQESRTDPKFKTELCKSWIENEFCIYGNKCRFAHGKAEIFNKPVINSKYKQKNCLSFFQTGHCNYGTRCHFKHDERRFQNLQFPHYSYKLMIKNIADYYNSDDDDCDRLSIFQSLEAKGKFMEEESSKSAKFKDLNNLSVNNQVKNRITLHFY